MNEKEVLRKNRLFSEMPDDQLSALCRDPETVRKTLGTGERLCIAHTTRKEGTAPFFGIVLGGKLSVFRERDRDRVLLNEIGVSGSVGAASLFGKDVFYRTTVEAQGRTRLLLFSQRQIEKLIREDGDFAVRYVSFLSDRIRFLNDRISSFTAGSAEQRLALYLMKAAERGPISISRTKLAAELDVGRASLYRALDRLTADGTVRTDGKTITVGNREALSAAAQGVLPGEAEEMERKTEK